MPSLHPAFKVTAGNRGWPDLQSTVDLFTSEGEEKVVRLLSEQPHRCKIADVNEDVCVSMSVAQACLNWVYVWGVLKPYSSTVPVTVSAAQCEC